MANPRPIKTVYDDGRVARSTNKEAAVRAAAQRLIKGDYWYATVVDEGEKELAVLVAHRREITITFKRGYFK